MKVNAIIVIELSEKERFQLSKGQMLLKKALFMEILEVFFRTTIFSQVTSIFPPCAKSDSNELEQGRSKQGDVGEECGLLKVKKA